jgi:hypothetical protein
MPTFQTTIESNIDLDFEVYCGTCGAGLCMESSTRMSRNRNHPQLEVNACPTCIATKQEEIDDLKSEIHDLQKKIEELENEKISE